MSEQLYTMANTKIYISDAPQTAKGEVTAADFAGINWIEIKGLYNLGELGGEQAINEFELISEVWTRKTKGGRNGGTMTNVFIPYFADPGQRKFKEAIEDNCRPYAFKVERGADCVPTSAVTVTVADPAVVTWAKHGLYAGQPVIFTTEGTMPAGLTAGVPYYVMSTGLTTDDFQLTATEGGTTAVEVTAAGTGTLTASAPPVGMTDLFVGFATDGTKSGGAKNDLYTQTWAIAVDGRVVTV